MAHIAFLLLLLLVLRISCVPAFLVVPPPRRIGRIITVVHQGDKPNEGDEQQPSNDSGEDFFDVRTKWKEAQEEAAGFWQDIVRDIDDDDDIDSPPIDDGAKNDSNEEEDQLSVPKWLTSMGENISNLLQGKVYALDTILSTVARDDDEEEEHRETTFFPEIVSLLVEYKKPLMSVMSNYLGDLDFSKLNPSALWYYMESQEEVKNPSWKRRQHRFCEKVDVEVVGKLYDKMILAGLSYADTHDDLRNRLNECDTSLVFANLTCGPAEPAHFIAVPRHQSAKRKDVLDIMMVIRGTKTLVDAITDLCGNNVDYRGGKAHEFVLKSGRFLVEKHLDLLRELKDDYGASQIQLTIYGHSLGAGAAAFVALELQDEADIDVEVYGFGTPAVLSHELAEEMASCMTTIVSDSDVVPRLSGETLANALLDAIEFDYRDRVERDLDTALETLAERQPSFFEDQAMDAAKSLFEPLLDKHMEMSLAPTTTERFEPVLFPPGRIAHFYRDGLGITARYVPNTFFREIDVTRRLVHDHLRFGYEQILLDTMRNIKSDLYYQFNTTQLSDYNIKARKAAVSEEVKDL